ncbi:DUF1499 domain-containing protein [Altererythrobacter lauratis]|uniref:DUF1499 domain-containing protein n=1 Tax=Alteraurantiacibacter lauratis TaxID=2054627 RepID=A0ABV7EJB6_9SPHN
MENAPQSAAPDPHNPTAPRWAPRLSKAALYVCAAAVVIAGTGLTLARYDLLPKMTGFTAFLGGGLVAAGALVLAIAALLVGWRTGNPRRNWAIGAAVVAAIYVGFLATRPMSAGDAPPIHDVTTDISNPPQFETLTLREDNLAGVGSVENWQQIHAAAYGDIGPVTLPMPVEQATAVVERLAHEEGWAIAVSDPARGHVEATASVSYIRFYDDIVFRITPAGEGASRIDMRSVSRVGVGDLGVNARRVRAFLARLTAV